VKAAALLLVAVSAAGLVGATAAGELRRSGSGEAGAVVADAAADSAAIRATALDYAEGWYAADGARMERALHPQLAKRIVSSDGRSYRLGHMGSAELVSMTSGGGGRDTPAQRRRADVAILDVYGNVASVRVTMDGWIDYMHMARWDGRWVIVNVLWELEPS
jgi:hypothetical protein